MARRTREAPPGVVQLESGMAPGGRPAKYPWQDWTDGAWWTVERGIDYDCATASFRTSLSEKARQLQLKYQSQVISDNGDPREKVAFQYYREVPGDLLERPRREGSA
jgi:hypothetical protein